MTRKELLFLWYAFVGVYFMCRMAFKLARIEAGYTQESLSEILGTSQQTISKWESGFNAPARMSQIKQIELLFNKSKEVIFPDVFR